LVVGRIQSVVAGALVAGVVIAPAAAQGAQAARPADQQRQSRYQISQMERMLEGAVEHGATVVREKLQAAIRAQTFVPENAENAHARGFRLDGYGVFFDIEVPALQGAFMWSLKTLDQNDLGLDSALKALKAHIDAAGDTNLQQALKRIELQVSPVTIAAAGPAVAASADGARNATGSPAAVADEVTPDPILSDPEEAYRGEVKQQIMEAMLDYSVPLGIGADEWLTVAARRHDDRPLLAPADSDARTVIIRIHGGDLAAFQARQISRDDALKRMEVRVF
jgi:hypothetical protein